jgi:8-oxo-dGTP pyrophosphatase MutT (NUDIX family)
MRLPHDAQVSVFRAGGEPQALLLRYAPEYGGYWHLVAGAVEPGETAAEAALRELREETGLEADLLPFRHEYAYPLDGVEPAAGASAYPAGTDAVRVSCFAVQAPAGWEPTLSEEHDQHRWCSREQAAELMRWQDAAAALELAFQAVGATA